MRSDDISLRRYHELQKSNPELFENPSGRPTKILFEPEELQEAQNKVALEREAFGWPTDDLRVGVLAEDPYIG